MDKELEELRIGSKLPRLLNCLPYKELPNVPLYMEQVIDYINKTLETAQDFR
jgi:hypothetical protein